MVSLATYNGITFWDCQFFTSSTELLARSCIRSFPLLGSNSVIIIYKFICFGALSPAFALDDLLFPIANGDLH